jgi:microsomal dipeptidase-like Zn-dependent dipeptidase
VKPREREADVEAVALAVHESAVVVDTVNRSRLDERFLEDIRTGGVTLLGRTILVSSGDVFSPFGFMESVSDITNVLQFIGQHSKRVMLVKTAQDIERTKATNRAGICLYFQSPEPLKKELWRLDSFMSWVAESSSSATTTVRLPAMASLSEPTAGSLNGAFS